MTFSNRSINTYSYHLVVFSGHPVYQYGDLVVFQDILYINMVRSINTYHLVVFDILYINMVI